MNNSPGDWSVTPQAADALFATIERGWLDDGAENSEKLLLGFYPVRRTRDVACNFRSRARGRRGLATGGDSFYEYLLKEQLVGGALPKHARLYDWFEARLVAGEGDGADEVGAAVWTTRSGSKHLVDTSRLKEHLSYFAPGLLALGARAPKRGGAATPDMRSKALGLAKALADGDAAAYARPSGNLARWSCVRSSRQEDATLQRRAFHREDDVGLPAARTRRGRAAPSRRWPCASRRGSPTARPSTSTIEDGLFVSPSSADAGTRPRRRASARRSRRP